MRVGSLCTGYGGLDMAAEAFYDATTAWVSDIDPGACRILEHRYPEAPNIGDFTTVDWQTVPPIDILTAGYPCQPFSKAGNRKGTTDERHLWPHVRQAIRHLRPRVTLLENVAGHRSLGFDRVLGDLAEDGMHVQWTSLRAADIGAPHSRERLFILIADPSSQRHGARENRRSLGRVDGPDESETRQRQRPWSVAGNRVTKTPANADGVRSWDADSVWLRPAGAEVPRQEPTVRGRECREGAVDSRAHDSHSAGYESVSTGSSSETFWGAYESAIRRWEHNLGRLAPPPTETSPKGAQRLSPRFVEFMMGLPDGWVTDVPGLNRNAQLKALGNGVVPQQAYAALQQIQGTVIQVPQTGTG